METSRSSTPEAPPQDLWSSILDSVSSSRSIPAKQVLILGEPSSGKSSLASALLQKPPAEDKAEDQDFALGYDWADVRDEADEGGLHEHYLGDVVRLLEQTLLPDCRSTLYHPPRRHTRHYYLTFYRPEYVYRTLSL